MPIYQTASYHIKKDAVSKVKIAIKTFVAYVKKYEPGTEMYIAWQQENDSTHFFHFFKFKNKKAQIAHGNSKEVKIFESIYSPELVGGDVKFTNFNLVASNK